VLILRDPAYNIGHWNLPDRPVAVRGGTVMIGERRARLVRFSGFDPERPERATRHNDRLTRANLGDAAALFGRYAALLETAGDSDLRLLPYGFGFFDNGVPIPDVAREIYAELGDSSDRFGDPFATMTPSSFYSWLLEPASEASALPNFWYRVWLRRQDLRAAFAAPDGAPSRQYIDWILQHGMRDVSAAVEFTPEARA
jgi:hypothetical protein